MKLTKAQLKELSETRLKTTWVNHGQRKTDFDGTLLEYCKDNDYKFTRLKNDMVKIRYTFGTNENITIAPAHKLTRTLVETVLNSKIYLGDEAKVIATNPAVFGNYAKGIVKI